MEHVQEGCGCVAVGRYFNISNFVFFSPKSAVVFFAVNAAPPSDLWENGEDTEDSRRENMIWLHPRIYIKNINCFEKNESMGFL